MNIVLVVTAGTHCDLFYKIKYILEKNNDVKILFTENAKKRLSYNLHWYFKNKQEYESVSHIYDICGKYKDIAGKGNKYYCYNSRYNKFPCIFDASSNVSGGFEHELYVYEKNNTIEHLELTKWADTVIISPCTINTYNKVNCGISDSFVLSFLNAFLGTSKPIYYIFDKSYGSIVNHAKMAVKTSISTLSNSFIDFIDFNNIKCINNYFKKFCKKWN